MTRPEAIQHQEPEGGPGNTVRVPAIGIIRVSAPGQRDRFGRDGQRKDEARKAEELGWEITDWWEYQESATDALNRPQFTGVLSDLVQLGQAGSIQGVLFAHPDRLGRDGPEAFFHYLFLLRQLGGLEIRFGQDDIDPSDRRYADELFEAATEAQRDARKIKRRTRGGRISRAESGKMPTGDKGLFGYIYNKQTGKRELHPENSIILRRAVDLILYGREGGEVGLRTAIRIIRQEHGVQLWPSSLGTVFRNPAICGRTVSRWTNEDGTVTEIPLRDVTPPIVTEEEFEALGAYLTDAKRWEGKQKKHFFPLAGMEMVICSHCQRALTGSSKADRGRQRREYRHRRDYECPNPYKRWPAHHLEVVVWDKLLDYFKDAEEAKRKLSEQVSDGRVTRVLETELEHLEEQLAAAEVEKTRLSRAWARGRMKDEEYENDIGGIEAKYADWGRRQKEIQQKLQALKELDLDRISDIITELAAENSEDDRWRLFPGSEEEQEEVGDYLRKFKLNGRACLGVDPETTSGRLIWQRRRDVLKRLGVRAYVRGRVVELEVNVPVKGYSQLAFTNTISSPSWVTMSISPQGHL